MNEYDESQYALEATEGRDYILKPEFTSVWVTVDNISVYIVRTDEGVSVDLYPKDDEMSDSLAGTWALFADADIEKFRCPRCGEIDNGDVTIADHGMCYGCFQEHRANGFIEKE